MFLLVALSKLFCTSLEVFLTTEEEEESGREEVSSRIGEMDSRASCRKSSSSWKSIVWTGFSTREI